MVLRRSTCAAWSGALASASRSPESTCPFSRARSMPCSGPTARARPRSCARSPGWWSRPRAPSASSESTPRKARAACAGGRLRAVERPLGLSAHLRRREPGVLRPPARACARRRRSPAPAPCSADVGLADRADDPVNAWSHGMQQRLSVARALLTDPPVLLIDEATHDLDPEAAATVRELIAARAEHGTAVLWATQRLDELRGFAGEVTLMSDGTAAFNGSVEALAARARARRRPPPRLRARAGLPHRRAEARHERRRAGRRGGEAPGVRPPRLEDRALLPRRVPGRRARPRDADLRLLRSSPSSSTRARCPSTAERCRATWRSSSSAWSSTSPRACCSTRSRPRCARNS